MSFFSREGLGMDSCDLMLIMYVLDYSAFTTFDVFRGF